MAKLSKKLSKTDIRKRLAVPTRFLSSLPSFNGAHAVDYQAVDEGGKVWTFKCSIRRRRHPKPVLSKGWLEFVVSKGLEAGDKIKLYKETNDAATAHAYKVRAKREIKIFGYVLGYVPITSPVTPTKILQRNYDVWWEANVWVASARQQQLSYPVNCYDLNCYGN